MPTDLEKSLGQVDDKDSWGLFAELEKLVDLDSGSERTRLRRVMLESLGRVKDRLPSSAKAAVEMAERMKDAWDQKAAGEASRSLAADANRLLTVTGEQTLPAHDMLWAASSALGSEGTPYEAFDAFLKSWTRAGLPDSPVSGNLKGAYAAEFRDCVPWTWARTARIRMHLWLLLGALLLAGCVAAYCWWLFSFTR